MATGIILGPYSHKYNATQVISYTMTKREINYCVTKKKMMALVFFVKQFRHYLLGKTFVLERTIRLYHDCGVSKIPKIKMSDGTFHRNPDSMSRRPNRNMSGIDSIASTVTHSVTL